VMCGGLGVAKSSRHGWLAASETAGWARAGSSIEALRAHQTKGLHSKSNAASTAFCCSRPPSIQSPFSASPASPASVLHRIPVWCTCPARAAKQSITKLTRSNALVVALGPIRSPLGACPPTLTAPAYTGLVFCKYEHLSPLFHPVSRYQTAPQALWHCITASSRSFAFFLLLFSKHPTEYPFLRSTSRHADKANDQQHSKQLASRPSYSTTTTLEHFDSLPLYTMAPQRGLAYCTLQHSIRCTSRFFPML